MSARSPYADPALYDLLHADGTEDEVWLLERLAEKHGVPEKTAYEPACGTGRYLEGLARRGWRVAGSDSSPKMAAYARKRLKRWGGDIRVGDMRTPPDGKYGLVFNLLSTFRHLMTDQDAVRHLNAVKEALLPDGLFVLGIDLADYGNEVEDEETWEIERGKKLISQVQMTIPATKKERREKVINFVRQPGKKLIQTEHELRSYDKRELTAILRRTKYEIIGVYGYDGKPSSLDAPERAFWLALRKAARTRRENAR